MLPRGLDELDLRIIAELQEDGRRSYREIGTRLGVSAGTIRARALQLMDEGVLEVIAVPNPWRMGFRFFAAIGLRLQPGSVEEVARELTGREEVSWVGLFATGYELMFEVVLADAQAFGRYREEVLAKLPGFVSADVYLLWDVRKLHYQMRVQSLPRADRDGMEPTVPHA
jgi:Lrp/AsnC family transcriptional regulator, regulator for asnA, asnC and gidA